MKTPKTLLPFIFLTILIIMPFVSTSSTLNITVSTDKTSYLIGESITVYGNLTYNGSPVQDWPVALEVQDPTGSPVVTRTLQTDTNGKYNLTFKLPTKAKLGTYTVYVSSSYKGETATNNTTFELMPVHNLNTGLSYYKIQNAIDAPETLDGHTIFVGSGTYVENVIVNKNNLTLIGKDRETTIIDGNGTGTVIYVTANNVTIGGFTIKNSGDYPNAGVYLDNVQGGNLSSNNIVNNYVYGVFLDSSSNNTVSGNNITNNNDGVYIHWSSSYNTVSGNNITNNNKRGVWLSSSSNNTVSGNNITNNNYHGVWLSLSSYNTVSGNNITSNGDGVWLSSSSNNNIVSGNNITNNNNCGAYLGSSSNNTVSGNNITNNWIGVRLVSSSYNTISGNVLSNNDDGVWLDSSSNNNTLSGNNITSNWYGVRLDASSYNKVYHNNFINNTKQVHSYEPSYNNTWDDGYPSAGNYWSEHSGVDLYSGPYQNETGSDGIGDAQYIIDENNQDNYPLMSPWTPPDIAVMNVIPSKTVVGQGLALCINVTTQNQGNKIELLNVTIYANTTIIATLTNVTLTSGNSTTISFTWNTTGFAKGNYTISACATPVSGETDTIDNTHTDGWVVVTLPGDAEGNYHVGSSDLFLFAAAYGNVPGAPNWNPNCDFDANNHVGSLDLFVLATHYGQSDC